jgi:hypothetical protein
MYLKQTCLIEFETQQGLKYSLKGLHNYDAKKSVHQTIQTCKIELPVSILYKNNDILEKIPLIDKIKEGDKIKVHLGYNGNNQKEFEGYIKRINPKMPLELECEDDMYLLRKIRLKKVFKKNDVRELLQYMMDELYKQQGVRFDLYKNIPKCQVFNFWMDNANGITTLQELEDRYLLRTFLTEIDGRKVLYCGLMYGLKKKNVNYIFNRNTISLDDLKYNRPDDRSFKVVIHHISPDGHEKKYTFGDPKGEDHEIRIQSPMSDTDIKHYAEGVLQGLQAGGYKGGFTTFLIPNVEPGDIAVTTDPQFKERSGNYYVSGVHTTFGSGARRKPQIEIKL